ncbi:transposase [Candidatus Kaiserbacteria bacterium]|nr:transposase [Candidatus Kaiserbacteria bacterium]
MELYHVLNRGVDKRPIYMEDGDRVRFVHCLWEFNDTRSANNTTWHISRKGGLIPDRAIAPTNDLRSRYSRKTIVNIHGWCLMGNHYHLLVSERKEGGLVQFVRKLNVGYAQYFNKKYERQGTLFQGRTKKVLIAGDAHFLHILHYIHLNPLDFLKGASNWRDLKVLSHAAALKHLENYKWSSYLDYCGKRNFPSVLTKELFEDVLGNYKHTIKTYLKDIEVEPIRDFLLE